MAVWGAIADARAGCKPLGKESPIARTKITPAPQRIGPFNPADSGPWDASGRQSNLLGIMDNDFGSSLILSNGPADFNLPPCQGCEISKLVLVGGKNHAGEWTVTIVLAKVEKSIAAPRGENPHHASGNAARLARVRSGVVEVHASCHLSGGGRTRSKGRWGGGRAASAATHQNSQAENYQNNHRHEYLLSPHLETLAKVGTPPGFTAQGGKSAKRQALLQSLSHARPVWEHGLPRSDSGSIPETADERSPRFQPLLCQRPCKLIKHRVVLGIEVVPAE